MKKLLYSTVAALTLIAGLQFASLSVNAATLSSDTTDPSTPTNLTATTASSARIDLSWTAATDNVGVTGYNVYRGGNLIASVSGTSFSDMGLSASTTFPYTLAAFDAAGNLSAQAPVISATTLSSSVDMTVPTTPTSLTDSIVSFSRVDLNWVASTDNVGVTGYNIYRNGIIVGTSTGSTFSDTGLLASTSYSYAIAAFDATGNLSGQSNMVSATTLANPDTSAPTVPTNLIATPVSSSQINLSWNASSDNVAVTGYEVFRNGVFVSFTSNPNYQDTGLTASTTYTYTIAAFDAASNLSAQSSPAMATTLAVGIVKKESESEHENDYHHGRFIEDNSHQDGNHRPNHENDHKSFSQQGPSANHSFSFNEDHGSGKN